MVEITEKEYELFQKLRKIFLHASAEKLEGVYFICGELGNKDSLGLPERILVCPAYGSDGFSVYKQERPYTAPGY